MSRSIWALLLGLLLVSAAVFAVATDDADEDDGPVKTETAAEPAKQVELNADQKAIEEAMKVAEGHSFQTEVTQLLDIIIHSLYSKREIFLRELISNAADAMDKIRFLSLTDTNQLGEGDQAVLDIKIKYDHERKLLYVMDKGLGMTKTDLVDNLGTIAHSGTKTFLNKFKEAEGDVSMIGQFGVGFYSAFLVADTVTVITKNNEDVQYIWQSTADTKYTITADPRGNTIGRGTHVILHLKDDAVEEFGDEDKLREIVKRYSEFVSYPISLWNTEFETKEVPLSADEIAEEDAKIAAEKEKKKAEAEEEEEEIDTDEEKEETEEADKKPRTKKVDVDVSEFKQVNTQPPIWLRSREQVTEEEYKNFSRSLSSGSDPLTHVHFTAEGKVNFRSILFVPERAPHDPFGKDAKAKIKLYVRRVFITDDFQDLIPRYLSFLYGVVDSDDMDLNVSREMLQQSATMDIIKKKVERKAIEMIQRLAKDEDDAVAKYEEAKKEREDKKKETAAEEEKKDESEEAVDEEKKEEEEEAELVAPARNFTKFYKEFGKNLRLGAIEDSTNRHRLVKLVRFYTSKSKTEFRSFEQYVAGMKKDQKNIYFIIGSSVEEIEKSPFLDVLLSRGYEVVYFIDAIDEYLVQHVTDFDNHKLVSITKEGLELEDDDAELEKKRKEYYDKELSALTAWLGTALKPDVERVVVSNRLGKTPCVISSGKYGYSANMERIMRAQALSTGSTAPKATKIMEINPRHPVILDLAKRVAADSNDELAREISRSLLDSALVSSGFSIENPSAFADRILRSATRNLKVDLDAPLAPELNEDDLKANEEPEEDAEDDSEEIVGDEDASVSDEKEEL